MLHWIALCQSALLVPKYAQCPLTNCLVQLLAKDPSMRITSSKALEHECFTPDILLAIDEILEADKVIPSTPKTATDSCLSPTSALSKEVACCLSVDGPGHPSADNHANYFLYARVVNMPSVCSYHVHKPKPLGLQDQAGHSIWTLCGVFFHSREMHVAPFYEKPKYASCVSISCRFHALIMWNNDMAWANCWVNVIVCCVLGGDEQFQSLCVS